MMEQIERKLRRRINVAQTSKGIKSWEHTNDGEGFTQEELLEKSDAMTEALESRYPVKEDVKA